ncbi:MAG: 16S rRNA (cytidine(1402)-2'-O)-methyltransferase [Candidatus Omnitrophica bacterium]|nr:16S rRNA (cytidine(1402)-2'-O)-methyltransferase [Candidatus Omnitrophota bacterium]
MRVTNMLYIVATPIGNLEDITSRAIRTLKEADFILAEDTRKTGFLLSHLGIKKPLISFFEHSEIKKIPWVIEELKAGKNIALVSDAGTPTISDPGYKLVRETRKEKLPVTVIPGASSITAALSITSIPRDKFIFLGYLPRKHNERARLFEKLKGLEAAIVFFESPFRVVASMEDMKSIVGNVKIALARELTKKFEEVFEGSIEEAVLHFSKAQPKGEFVVILDGKELNVTA